MKIKVGESLITKLRINVEYKCQFCGHQNYHVHDLEVSTDNDSLAKERNRMAMAKKLEELQDNANPKIYPKLNIDCYCGQCDNIPVWARFNFSKQYKAIGVFLVLAFLAFLFWSPFSKIAQEQNTATQNIICAAFYFAFLAGAIFIFARIQLKRMKNMKYIDNLPAEYLPIFKLHR